MMNDYYADGTLPNKHWKMPWGQTFTCVVCNPLLKNALTCHDIFQYDPELSCLAPVEADLYSSKRPLMTTHGFTRDINFCAICAGKSNNADSGKIDPDLNEDDVCNGASYLRHMQESQRKDISRSLQQWESNSKRFDQNLRSIVVAATRN